MRWRRKQYRNGERRERPHLRNIKYEAAKESAGKLIDAGAAAVGGLIGAQATRAGLPLDPAMGAVLGGALGAGGKAMVVGTLDMLKGRKSRQSADGNEASGSPASRVDAPLVSSRTQQSIDQSSAMGGLGSIISAIGDVMSQLETAEKSLVGVAQHMHVTHEWVMNLLAGGRAEKMIRPMLGTAQNHVEDAVTIIQQAQHNLRSYLGSL